MAVGELDEQHSSVHECNNARPNFICDNNGMDEEEKEEAFMHYLRRGYYHPSMTKEVESKASLTEMYVKSTVPVCDEDFDDQFDLKHLSKIHKRLKVFKKNKEAFSKHACDLGCSTGIEMDIPILTKEPQIQKDIPVPHAVTTESSLRSDARIWNHPRMQRTIVVLFQSIGHKEERRKKHQSVIRRTSTQQLHAKTSGQPSDSPGDIRPTCWKSMAYRRRSVRLILTNDVKS
jgi:hypothetical protein